MKSYFVFDVESVGLHGDAFAVGGGVYLEDGSVQWEFRYVSPLDGAQGTQADFDWVKENVPNIKKSTHKNRGLMMDEFWAQWEQAKDQGAVMAVDCGWPVEAKFLEECVARDLFFRRHTVPYPLIEISTLRLACGLDPIGPEKRKPSERPVHDPLADARQSARLLVECLKKLKKKRA